MGRARRGGARNRSKPPLALSVRFAEPSFELRMEAMAEVDLTVDAATVARWRAVTEPLAPAKAKAV